MWYRSLDVDVVRSFFSIVNANGVVLYKCHDELGKVPRYPLGLETAMDVVMSDFIESLAQIEECDHTVGFLGLGV